MQEQTVERLTTFVHRLEDKLRSVQSIHEKLHELLLFVSTTHENILEELQNIKGVLQQVTAEQQSKPIVDKQRTDDSRAENDKDRAESSSNGTSDATRRESPKRSEQSARPRLSKSVSFSLEKNLLTPRLGKETSEETTNLIPVVSPSDLFKSHSTDFSSTNNNAKVLTHVRIHEIEPNNGEYLRLVNVSTSEDYELGGHVLQQNTPNRPLTRFRFPPNTTIRAGQTITIWCSLAKDITPQPPHVFVWKEQRRWETAPECLTSLVKPNGQSIAWFRNNLPVNADQSSSDLLFVHSKSPLVSAESPNTPMNPFNRTPSRLNARPARLSAFHSFSNGKYPFTHPPTSAVHPDYRGSTTNTPSDLRAQLNQRVGMSYAYPRAKSSTIAGRSMDKQDFAQLRLTGQTGNKPNTVQT